MFENSEVRKLLEFLDELKSHYQYLKDVVEQSKDVKKIQLETTELGNDPIFLEGRDAQLVWWGMHFIASKLPTWDIELNAPPVSTPQTRLIHEYEQGKDRLDKLKTFLGKGKPYFISDDQWMLMHAQAIPMEQYVGTLRLRIDNLDKTDNLTPKENNDE